jgi:hypothetical protein
MGVNGGELEGVREEYSTVPVFVRRKTSEWLAADRLLKLVSPE